MSDPNRIEWTEQRTFTARFGALTLFVWVHAGRFLWDERESGQEGRGGVERCFLAAKRAAEKCARAWASVDAYCLPGGKEGRP